MLRFSFLMLRFQIDTGKAFNYIFILLSLIVVIISVQLYFSGDKTFVQGGEKYTHYNNYLIFKNSFHHLINNQDLYIHYPQEYWDLYKYSPTFSVFFSFFYILPDWLGITIWNFVNAFLLFLSVRLIPALNNKQKVLIILTCLVEIITSMQNMQSNALMSALLILTYIFLEKRNVFWATFFIVLSVYIKIFSVVGFVIFLFYPNKIKSIAYTLFWFGIFFLLPTIFIDFKQLLFLYKSWGNLLANDHHESNGLSVIGWLNNWFGYNGNKLHVVLIGIAFFLLPFIKIKSYSNPIFKLLILASVLIWVVIFNHRAESPTFIVAMIGVAFWFFSQKRTIINSTLLILAIVFTSLSATDLFPPFIRNEYFIPYSVKVVPCILIWVKLLWDSINLKNNIDNLGNQESLI